MKQTKLQGLIIPFYTATYYNKLWEIVQIEIIYEDIHDLKL